MLSIAVFFLSRCYIMCHLEQNKPDATDQSYVLCNAFFQSMCFIICHLDQNKPDVTDQSCPGMFYVMHFFRACVLLCVI